MNTDGRLIGDRPVVAKAQLVYQFPLGIMASANVQHQTGKFYSRQVRVSGLGFPTAPTINMESNTGDRRVEDVNLIDMRVQKSFSMPRSPVRLDVFLDALNLTNSDQAEGIGVGARHVDGVRRADAATSRRAACSSARRSSGRIGSYGDAMEVSFGIDGQQHDVTERITMIRLTRVVKSVLIAALILSVSAPAFADGLQVGRGGSGEERAVDAGAARRSNGHGARRRGPLRRRHGGWRIRVHQQQERRVLGIWRSRFVEQEGWAPLA